MMKAIAVENCGIGEYIMNNDKEMFLCSGFDLSSAREFLMQGIHNKGTLFIKKKDD